MPHGIAAKVREGCGRWGVGVPARETRPWTRSSDRVVFSGGSDNIGSWQQNTYQKLKEMSLRKTVCHVNPDNLDDAVLLREIHEAAIISTSLFGSVFTSISIPATQTPSFSRNISARPNPPVRSGNS